SEPWHAHIVERVEEASAVVRHCGRFGDELAVRQIGGDRIAGAVAGAGHLAARGVSLTPAANSVGGRLSDLARHIADAAIVDHDRRGDFLYAGRYGVLRSNRQSIVRRNGNRTLRLYR